MWIDLVNVLREVMDVFSVPVLSLTPPFTFPEEIEESDISPEHRALERMLSAAIERMLYGEVLRLELEDGSRYSAFLHPEEHNVILLVGPWREDASEAFRQVLLRLIGLFYPKEELTFTRIGSDLKKELSPGL